MFFEKLKFKALNHNWLDKKRILEKEEVGSIVCLAMQIPFVVQSLDMGIKVITGEIPDEDDWRMRAGISQVTI